MGRLPARQLGGRTKKLIDAARQWAGADIDQPKVDSGVADALAAFGARPVDVDAARARQREQDFEVYPENWKAVRVFLALSTQWRMVALSSLGGGHAIHTGLDYGAVEPTCRLMGIKRERRAAIFRKIRVMEEAALDALLSD